MSFMRSEKNVSLASCTKKFKRFKLSLLSLAVSFMRSEKSFFSFLYSEIQEIQTVIVESSCELYEV